MLISFHSISGTMTDPLSSYTGTALPQYMSGLYGPASLTNNTINTIASVVAGKQIEGEYK